MNKTMITERDVTKEELERVRVGFVEHQAEYGIPETWQQRHGFVVMDSDKFVGCVSGLTDNNWFYISDLWLEKAYRRQGLGAALLRKLEAKVVSLGIRHIYTWTAAYEAPDFYKKQEYKVFCELENWFVTGHSRIGFRKNLIVSK